MPKETFRILSTIFTALIILATSCSSNGDNSQDSDSLTIYSGRSEELIQPLIEDFEAETGIKVEVKFVDSIQLASQIELEAEKSPADVFISQSPGAMGFLEQNNLLGELPDNVLSSVEANVRDNEGLWVGISGRQRVMVYNQTVLSSQDLPTTIAELTDPQWKGKVALAPNNGSFQDFVTAMRASLGDEETAQWLKDMAENDPVIKPDNKSIVTAVNDNQAEIGLVNHYYNFRAIDQNKEHNGLNSQFSEGDPGNVLIVTAAAKLKNAPNPENADLFIEWLLNTKAQTYLTNETFEYPLASEVEPYEALPQANFTDTNLIQYENLTEGLSETQKMIEESGLSSL